MLICTKCKAEYMADVSDCAKCGNEKLVVLRGVYNLTPHPVVLFLEHDYPTTLRPSGVVARVELVRERVGDEEFIPDDPDFYPYTYRIPVVRIRAGKVTGLPSPREGVRYIVSRTVMEAVADRDDLLVPDELVRDESGRVIGARALARGGAG